MTLGFLPYGRQTIEDDDIASVVEALRATILTTGPKVEEFEAAFAGAAGAHYAIACNSGTAALHLALLAHDIGPRDTAIVPTLTFVATANAVRMAGAEVVFADVDADTGLMTPDTLRSAITRAKAAGLTPTVALPVHLNGQLCDMPALAAIAAQAGIVLIEDACHALGVKEVGASQHSRAACFSTHPVKAIATGEGGVVTTADAGLATRMRQLRSHGLVRDAEGFANRDLALSGGEPNPWYYEMPEIGWNYRIPDVLCALGISQLQKLNRFWNRRREIAAHYDKAFASLSSVLRPVSHGTRPHAWHLYAVLIDFAALGMSRAAVMNALRDEGIGTQVHYIPVHRQPYYRRRYGEIALPGADAYYARCLSIPLFPMMSEADVDRVIAAVAGLARGRAAA